MLKDLKELVDQALISEQQATDIADYYEIKQANQPNRLSLIMGILGAIFIGLAIILILAHNWDQFSRTIRVVFAFFPLLLAQIFLLYTLLKKSDYIIWREISGILLFFSFAATVFITSQIYNISDPYGYFYLTWVVLTVPLIYILRSSVLSMMCIGVITYYNMAFGFQAEHGFVLLYYYIIMVAILPYYFSILRKAPNSNTAYWLHWMIALSVVLSTMTLGVDESSVLIFTFMGLSTFFYNWGQSQYFENTPERGNAFTKIGQFGIAFVLLLTSFQWIWEDVWQVWKDGDVLFSWGFIGGAIYSVAALVLYFRRKAFQAIHLLDFDLILIPFALIFMLHLGYSAILVNILTLALGVVVMLRGIKKNQLLTINFGLLIISVLILSRFFESDLSYLLRGIIFAVVGLAFFMTNYLLTKKRKNHEK